MIMVTAQDAASGDALLVIARAEKAVDDLCQGRLRWEMRVPAEPDHDPDLIISEALRRARSAVVGLQRSIDAMDTVRAGLGVTDQSAIAIGADSILRHAAREARRSLEGAPE